MKVLITGVAGFLGSHLAQKLLSQGNQIIGIDNMMGGYEDNIPQNITFHKNDCCDYEKMSQIMKGVDVVYHCAATEHEGLSVFSPQEITKNNLLLQVNLLNKTWHDLINYQDQ